MGDAFSCVLMSRKIIIELAEFVNHFLHFFGNWTWRRTQTTPLKSELVIRCDFALDKSEYYSLVSVMNLFYLSDNHEENASFHADKHMKMLLEATQLLCTTFHLQEIHAPYRRTHQNHPSAIWTRAAKNNFKWVISYADSLSKEYSYRYGKRHASSEVLLWAQKNARLLRFPQEESTPFALAMPDEFKTSCPIESYRNYYREAKKHLHSWKNRDKPYWI